MATSDGSMKIGMVIQAQTAQAKAALAELQTQIGAVTAETGKTATASQAAATATDQVTTSAASAAEAVNAWGETEAQVQARLQGVARSAIEASNASAQAARAAVANADASRTAAGANAAQAESTAALVARQNAAMAVSSRVVAAQAEIATALKAKSLTEAQSLEVENMINRARAAGLISAAEQSDAIKSLAAIKVVDAKATEADTKAITENTAASALNYRSRREVGTIGAEALAGNFGRVRTSGLALFNDMGLFTKLLTPMGLAIGGVAAAVGLLVGAEVSAEREQLKFNQALAATGTQSGVTGAELVAVASNVGQATGSYGAATEAVLALTRAGQGASPALEGMAALAVRFGTAIGDTKAGIDLATVALTGNAQQVAELDKKYDLLTATQANEVQHLFAIGQADQARQIIMREGSTALANRAKDVEDSTGIIIKAWRSVTSTVAEAWHEMAQAGASDVSSRLKAVNTQLAAFTAPGTNPALKELPAYQQLLQQQASLRAQLVQQGWDRTNAALDTARQTAAKAAQDWANKALAPIDALQSKLDQATQAKAAFFSVPRTAEESARFMRSFEQQVQQAAQAYNSATEQHTSKSGGAKGPDLGALQARAQVTAIQQSLTTLQNAWQNTQKVLDAQHRAGQMSDADYFDTLRKDLDTYTAQRIATLEQEKVAAEAHVKTAADRIRADQQVAKIDAEITQAQQDAAAKREQIDAQEQKAIDDTKNAWLQLQSSLGVPVDVNTSKAMRKLSELYALLKKLNDADQAPGQDTVNNMIGAALMTGVEKSPRLRSERNIPGQGIRDNPLALVSQDRTNEEAAFAQQQRQLAQNYAAAQQLAKGNDQKLLQLQQQYQTDSEALANQHKDQMAKIDQAQYWGTLQVASNIFGQLATLSSSQNKKVAAAGKAAAIAGALIDTYASAVKAYKAGLEVGGPAAPVIAAAYAAVAIAAGMANVAQIRAQPTGGYATGGHVRGAGSGTSDSIPAMLSHGEYVVRAAAVKAVGVPTLDAINRAGFAAGGLVSPFANAPSPAQLGFQSPSRPRVDFSKLAAANGPSARAAPQPVKVVVVMDKDQMAHEIMNTPTGQKVIVQTAGDNPRAIRGKWGA